MLLALADASAARLAKWIVAGNKLEVKSDVLEAKLSVRTFPGQKPLAYATLTGEGEGYLYASSRCVDT